MNKYKIILVSIFAFALYSCSEDDWGSLSALENLQVGTAPHYLNVSKTDVKLASKANSSAEIFVRSINTSWGFNNVPKEWLTVSPEQGTDSSAVVLKASTENPSGYESRIVLLSLESLSPDFFFSKKVAVTQSAGTPYAMPENTNLVTDWQANTLEVEVQANVEWKPMVVSGINWYSAKKEGSKLLISVDKNLSEDRHGEVYIFDSKSDKSLARVNVKQGMAGVSANVENLNFGVVASSQSVIVETEVDVADFKVEVSESWISSAAINRLGASQIKLDISVLDNHSLQSRNGYVYLLLDNSRRVSVLVQQKGIDFTVEGTLKDFDGEGVVTNEMKVIADDDWKVYAKPQWLTVDPVSGQTGENLLTLTADKNNSVLPREGVLSLGLSNFDYKKDFTVKQLGLEVDIEKLLSFGWEGSKKTVEVPIPGKWEAICEENWISLSKKAGTGNDKIEVSVSTNPNEDGRTGVISFVSEGLKQSMTVVQEGQYLKVEASTTKMTIAGGDISIDVQTSVGAKDSLSYVGDIKGWIVVDKKENGYVLHVAENVSMHDRSALFFILPSRSTTSEACKSGVKLTVEQSGRKLNVNVGRIDFYGKGGTSETYNIQADGSYQVHKGNNGEWYVLNHNEETHVFSVKANENPLNEKRVDTLTFELSGLPEGEVCQHSVILVQHGKNIDEGDFDENGFAQPSKQILTYEWLSGKQVVDVDANVDWKAQVKSGSEWIHIESDRNHLTVSVDKNELGSRKGQIAILNATTAVELAVIGVEQGMVDVSASVQNLNFKVNGGSQIVEVKTTAPVSEFSTENTESWLSSSCTQNEAGKINWEITATSNNSLSPRNGEVHLLLGKSKRLTMTVNQQSLSFSVEGNIETFDAKGTKTNKLSVSSNESWKVISKPEWLTVTPASGQAGDYQLSLNASQNSSVSSRTGALEIGLVGFDLKKTFEIKQFGMNASVENRIDFSWESANKGTDINIPSAWTAEPSSNWIALSQDSGTGPSRIEVTVKHNDSEYERAGKILFKSEGKVYEMNIVQKGQYLRVKSSDSNIGVAGGEITVNVESTVGARDSISYAQGADAWINVNRVGEDDFVLQVAKNNSSKPRRADCYVRPTKSVTNPSYKAGVKATTIEQAGRKLQVNVSNLTFQKEGGKSALYTISADGEYSLNKANGDDWYTVNYDALKHSFSIVADENRTSETRKGTLTISLTGLPAGEICEKKVVITQYSKYIDTDLDDFGDDENWNPGN